MSALNENAARLMICLTTLISGCGTTKGQIVSFGGNIPRPHNTISQSCKKSQVPSDCAAGLSTAIDESVKIVSRLEICESELFSCTAHADTETWFYQGQLASANEQIETAKDMRWIWGAAGVATGAISVILGLFFYGN